MTGIGIGRFAKGRPAKATEGSGSSLEAKTDPPSVPGTITLQTETEAAATPTANPSRQESGWSNASTNDGFQDQPQDDGFCFADDGGNFFDHGSETSSNHFMNDTMSFDNASFGGNSHSAFEDDVMPPKSGYHKMHHHGHGPSGMASNSPLRVDKPKIVFGFSRFATKKNKTPPTDASKCHSEKEASTKNHKTAATPNPGGTTTAPPKTTRTPGLQDTAPSHGTNAGTAPGANPATRPAPMATPSPASTANPPPVAMESDRDATPANQDHSRRISFDGSPGTIPMLGGYRNNNDAGTNPRRVSTGSGMPANEKKSPPFHQEETQEEQEQLRRGAPFANTNITDNRRMRKKAAAITPNSSAATTTTTGGTRNARANPNQTATPMTATVETTSTSNSSTTVPASGRAVDGMELSFESNQASFLTTIRETADLQGKIDQDLMDMNERFSEYYSLLLRDLETAVNLLDQLEDIEQLADETLDLHQKTNPPGSGPSKEEGVLVGVAPRDDFELERAGDEPVSNS